MINGRKRRVGRMKEENGKLLFLKDWVINAKEGARAAVSDMVEAVQVVLQPSMEKAFDFRVVLSELINNEFEHGSCETVRVNISTYASGHAKLRIYGSPHDFDFEEELEKRRNQDDNQMDERGRGLLLAAALCETLGTETYGQSRVVCARMRLGN